MVGASIETTLELWASSRRDVKARLRPLFCPERVAASAWTFLAGTSIWHNHTSLVGSPSSGDLICGTFCGCIISECGVGVNFTPTCVFDRH